MKASSVLVGLSGGVDSASSALTLLQNGWNVAGLYCLMHDAGEKEYEDAKRVAEHLGVVLFVADLREKFRDIVTSDFISQYKNGRTPNPCIICNPLVKFAALCEYADRNFFERIATGHYAGVGEREGRYYITKNISKDQSYMLSRLPQDVLSRLTLPLYSFKKEDVRAFAQMYNVPVSDKPDSQDICFIPGGGYGDYLTEHGVESAEGDFILLPSGEKVGQHKGCFRYTVGQRKNLGVALGKPAYVVRTDPKKNIVYLAFDDPFSGEASVSSLCWQYRRYRAGNTFTASVKTRFGSKEQTATVHVLPRGKAEIKFDKPVRAIAPGQTAVFYNEDAVIGAGFLD